MRWALAFVVALALGVPATASGKTCIAAIHGERITTANHFEASGLSCENAVRSAAGFTDSAARFIAEVPGTDRFTAEFYEWRYRWLCHATGRTARQKHLIDGVDYGADYRCHAAQELNGHRLQTAYMRFRWWEPGERQCPDFPLEDEVNETTIARQVSTTRNQSCAEAREWLKTAAEQIQYELEPYRTKLVHLTFTNADGSEPESTTELRYEYHYFFGGLYNCTVAPTKLSENGPKGISCEPVLRGWESREYSFAER